MSQAAESARLDDHGIRVCTDGMSPEIFETEIRGTAVGSAAALSRLCVYTSFTSFDATVCADYMYPQLRNPGSRPCRMVTCCCSSFTSARRRRYLCPNCRVCSPASLRTQRRRKSRRGGICPLSAGTIRSKFCKSIFFPICFCHDP